MTPRALCQATRCVVFAMTWILSLLIPDTTTADPLTDLTPLTERTELLGGRLTIRMPQGARIEQRRASIMAAPHSIEAETRVVVEVGKEKLVLMAYEMYLLQGADFQAGAKAYVQDWSADPAKRPRLAAFEPVGKGMKAFGLSFDALDTSREAVLVLGLLVGHTDGTVQYLAFYLNPEAAGDADAARDFVRRIAKTVEPGPRSLDRKGGTRRLATRSAGGSHLVITLPTDHLTSRQDGPDFVVHRVERLAILGKTTGSLGIYVGGHPSYQHQQYSQRMSGGGSAPTVAQKKGTLLGRAIEWHEWQRPGGEPGITTTTRETILPLTPEGHDRVHVFMTAPTQTELDALAAIAVSMKLQ